MDVFIQFVCDHSHVIIESFLTIIVLFVTIFKKKVIVKDVFEVILLTLPDLINQAETLKLKGSDKFSYVFNHCVVLIQGITHKKASQIIDEYSALINEAIENILSTPQKKER